MRGRVRTYGILLAVPGLLGILQVGRLFIPLGLRDDVTDLVVGKADQHFELRVQHGLDGRFDGRIRKIGARVALHAAHAQLRIHLARHQRDRQHGL